MRVTVGLERLSACPHQYELAEAKGPSGRLVYAGAAYLGSCFHAAFEKHFKDGTDLAGTLQEFSEAWLEGRPLQSNELMTKDNVDWTDSKNPDYTEEETFQDGLEMVKLYYPIAATLQPKLVEHHGVVEVDGEPIEFHVDLVTQDGKLIDLKTGRRTKSTLEADVSIQLSVYAWGLRKLGIWRPSDEEVELHSTVRLKKGGRNKFPYKTSIIKSRRNLINYEWVDEVFIPRLLAMKRSGAFPANPGIHCSYCPVKEFCGHWNSVQEARESRTLAERDSAGAAADGSDLA